MKKKNFFKKHFFGIISFVCIIIIVGLFMIYPTTERPRWAVYVILLTTLVLFANIIAFFIKKMAASNESVYDKYENKEIEGGPIL